MNKQSGFSLVELAISLVIAGLIIGAITSGMHLMDNARLTKVISEISGYKEAVEDFRLKYDAWPGDMDNATSFWGAYNAGTNPKGVSDGDGNEQIGAWPERYQAWKHLSRANMIDGYYTGLDAGTPNITKGVNSPASGANKRGNYILVYASDFFDAYGNTLAYVNSNTVTDWEGVLTPQDAHIIDTKIDDGASGTGSASTGDVVALRGGSVAGDNTKCVNPNYTGSGGVYLLTDNTVSCRMFIFLDKE